LQSKSQAERVSKFLSQGQRFMDALQGLVWIAEHPYGHGRKASARYAGVLSVHKGMGAVLLRIIEGHPLLKVRSSWSHLSKPEHGLPQHPVRLQEERRVLCALGQAEKLLPQLTCRLQLRPEHIKPPQPIQHRNEL